MKFLGVLLAGFGVLNSAAVTFSIAFGPMSSRGFEWMLELSALMMVGAGWVLVSAKD